jgi:hypothetical protein
MAMAIGAGVAADWGAGAGVVTVPWAIQAAPLSAAAGAVVAGVAAPTIGAGAGASAQAALGAAPTKLKNIIAAAVIAPRTLGNFINRSLTAVSACAGRDR